MREQLIQSQIMAVFNQRDAPTRLWRNNVGKFWSLPEEARCKTCKTSLKAGRNIDGAHMVMCGLGLGSADLIGVEIVTITPEMVGTTLARFLAVEVKTPSGRVSPEQEAWLRTVRSFGGEAHVMRSPEEAASFLGRKK